MAAFISERLMRYTPLAKSESNRVTAALICLTMANQGTQLIPIEFANTNPYQPPQVNGDSVEHARSADAHLVVRGPAIMLMVASVVWAVPLCFALFIDSVYLLVAIAEPTVKIELFMAARVMCLGLITIINLIVFWGAAKMLVLKNYRASHLAAVLAIVPLCGPLVFLGVPLGIWAIFVLDRPHIRRSFES